MPLISAKLMENTWRRIGAFEGRDIIKLHKGHRKAQPALCLFVYSILPSIRDEAGGVAIYVYHVVLEAFQRAEPRPKRVTKPQIELAIREMEKAENLAAEELEAAPTAEPHALRYVVEALTEAEDPVLTGEEIDSIYRMLWVAIECLHRACGRGRGTS